jgi:Fe-S cluster biogenesis protein NfuA
MQNNTKELTQNVSLVIERDIRPYIEADGGRIVLKSVDDEGNVYVQLAGACAGCPGAVMTLKGGVERILKMKVPGVKEVKLAY